MSLINQMLKNIEKRTTVQTVPKITLLDLRPPRANKGINRYWIIAGLFTFIFFIPFFITKLTLFKSIDKSTKPSLLIHFNDAATKPIISTPGTILPNQYIVPTALTGITLQIRYNMTYMRFLLTHDVLYRVNYDADQNILTLFLDHTRITTTLPVIDYANSAIKNMEVINLPNGDLKIILMLNSEVEVKNLLLDDVGKFPELRLELSSQPFSMENIAADIKNQSTKLSDPIQYADPLKKLTIDMAEQEEYQKALNLTSTGNYQQAERELTELIIKHPDYPPARLLLAKLLLQQGDTKDADRLLQIGLQQQPNYVPFVELRARILADAGKNRQALSLLQQASPSLAENPDYYSFIAVLYQRLGEPAMSAKLYKQLLAVNSHKAAWWVGLGIALEALDRHSEAKEAYSQAASKDELTPELSAYISSRIA